MFPFIDYTVNVILWHVLHLTCFVTKKASHDTILVMLLDTIFDDLLLYLHNDLISLACKSRKKIKSKLQTVQNRCIRYCLQQDNRNQIGLKEFEKIKWLPVCARFNQYLCSIAFKLFKKLSCIFSWYM